MNFHFKICKWLHFIVLLKINFAVDDGKSNSNVKMSIHN